jgi:hypothetical protein
VKSLALGKTDTKTPEVRFLMDTDFPSKLTHFRESKVEAYPYLKSLPVYRYRADS